jgi:hypothetical protein
MQWVVITANDLNDYLVGVQVDALRQTALADGQDDPFTRVMQDRASYVRRRIEGNPSNRISATPYAVPPELKTGTCYSDHRSFAAAFEAAANGRPEKADPKGGGLFESDRGQKGCGGDPG